MAAYGHFFPFLPFFAIFVYGRRLPFLSSGVYQSHSSVAAYVCVDCVLLLYLKCHDIYMEISIVEIFLAVFCQVLGFFSGQMCVCVCVFPLAICLYWTILFWPKNCKLTLKDHTMIHDGYVRGSKLMPLSTLARKSGISWICYCLSLFVFSPSLRVIFFFLIESLQYIQ